jgi:ribosomal protein S8
MSIINKLKQVLSKIKVAQCSKKVTLKIIIVDIIILNILWTNGFIYGYHKIQDSYTIFLRYGQGSGIFKFMIFLDYLLTKKQIKMLLLLDPHYSYLLLTNKGVVICSIGNIVHCGGVIIAKV